jgi:outer membrane lipoprotein-sorting protein
MKRNLALSILFLPLTAAMGFSQTAPASPANPPAQQTTSAPAETKAESAKGPQSPPTAKPGQTPAQTGEHAAANSGNDLSVVLAKMNQSANGFRSAQGNFQFVTYQKLVDDKDTQSGRIYFRRKDKTVDAAFEIDGPAPKQVVYSDGKVQVYEKKINQVTVRNVGKNQADVEAFLSLGFGASGNDLLQQYDVKMDGWETIDGVKTAKLDLTPKSEKMRQTYSKIILWIDPEKDVLLQQQFFESSGDYRLAHYTNMKVNGKSIPNDAFRLKTNGSTKVVTPQ